ncbi:RagB/SusD family nutrient uptake outer membrane protein [Niastella caeni]|uniref:RagB/SusD family nutrient uptake outer membrane protein n=1 Tax=Niastella caeni TaxID=2569763 RepID=A0A4S8HVK3_9BACT|nr:RagB/SusD family nutrient uptake outer membrane protein [Niastella caeni]THU39673.1 RagB/SusD family nutrient uptake outer membrane protein [Niastella caeni]
MKKTLNTIIIFCMAAIVLNSCAKKLDIEPEGSPVVGNFWKTSADAISGANALYEQFDGEEFYGRGYMWYMNASDDMVTGRSNAKAENVKNFNSATPGVSYLTDQWKMRYIVIKRTNDVILNVPGINMDANLKNRILGEAYFLRGLMYFQLSYNYGNENSGVPIVTEENSSSTAPVARTASVSENYTLIESDLKKAAALLPYFDMYAVTDYGRGHKTAAWAYLSKMYLYTKSWANAEKYADSVINSGKHALLTNFTDVFTVANNWSKEYIWSALSTPKGTGGWGSILPGVMLENKGWGKYNGWGYFTPTKELYDAYETGDKRREATILKPGDTFKFFGKDTIYGSNNSLSGYQFRKYMEPFSYSNPIGTYISPNGDHPTTALNPPLLRYAEVVLIKAEAKIMQGKSADAEINAIRTRAGLTAVSGATIAELKKQRRCELAGEWADRHRDLVRWGDAQAVYAQPLHGFSGAVIWPARTFNPAVHNVWPVPSNEISNSGGVIKQSTGW